MNTSTSPNKATRWLLVVALVVTALWFATLGCRRLLEPDEGRYAEISREMVVTGDWTTPRLNGVKYFEKPALQYWATAVAYKVFGINEFSARLWTGLTGFLGVLFAWITASRLYSPATGRMAAAILASSLMYVVLSHLNTLDIGLASFLEVAVFSFLLAQHAPPRSRAERSWMLLAWASAALAFLSKGLIALILPGLTLVVYSVVTREFSAWKRLHVTLGLPLFLLISVPWIVAVTLKNPEFPYFFFLHEQFERFLTTIHRRDEPWWYFLPLLALGALPWTSLWLAEIKESWRLDRGNGFQTRRFLLLWIVVVIGFFSVSHSKLAPYIAPVFAAIAVLLSDALTRVSHARIRWHFVVIGLVVSAIAMAVILVPNTIAGAKSIDLVTDLRPETAVGLLLSAYSLFGAAYLLGRNSLHTAILAAGLGTLLGLNVLLYGADALSARRSAYDLAIQLKPQLSDRNTLYSVDLYEQSLPFYLGRTMKLVAYRGELDFGITQQPELWIPDIDAFLRAWAYDAHPIAVLHQDLHQKLLERGVTMRIVAQQNDLVAVAKY